MIKRGYHRLRTPEGRVVEGPLVVELAEEATEWIGGEFKAALPQNS